MCIYMFSGSIEAINFRQDGCPLIPKPGSIQKS